MTIPFYCVIVAFLLIMITKAPLAVAQGRQKGGYDNQNPRDQQAALTGWGRRAAGAHNNTIEAFPGFAVGVIIAHVVGADPTWSARLAITFIVARLIYPVLYIANVDKLRSTVWGVGFAASAALMALGAF